MNVEYEYVQDLAKSIYAPDNTDNSCLAHFHSKIEFIYVQKNKKRVVINDDERFLQPNQMAVSLAYDAHFYIPEENGEQTVLVIPKDYFLDYDKFFADKKLKTPFLTNEEDCKELKYLIDGIVRYKNDENICRGLASALLYSVANKIGLTDKNDKNENSLTKKLLVYIEENHSENLTLDALAKKFGYSRNYMSHVFNKHVGCDFCGYLNSVRLKKVIAEAVTTDENKIIELCYRHGFNSLSTFYRCFKRYYNKAPNEFFKR